MPFDPDHFLSEEDLREWVDLLVRLVEAAGAVVIIVGALLSIVKFLRVLPSRRPDRFTEVRLTLGRFLALGLEFQLASDVLRTAVAPSFEELGKLAAVAAIRTALNFFLAREIRQEMAQVDRQARASQSDRGRDPDAEHERERLRAGDPDSTS